MHVYDITDSVDEIQNNILKWFQNNGRHWVPWKLTKDGSLVRSGEIISPYGIWIAEVMLQQTQFNVAINYWNKWMQSFPTLNDLAESDQQHILLIWQGLGYYSRAKYIFNSSQLLVNMIGKNNINDPTCWPSELEQWLNLPGIGRSTAGSIISSAYDIPAPILDGNVKRILSRLIASEKPTIKNQKQLWDLSNLLLSVKYPRDFNQALMDLGALVCTINNPSCDVCPLQKFCLAYIKYDPINFPKRQMKKKISKQEIGLGIVFNKTGQLLIDQRLETSSMGGMWEFPGGKREMGESIEETIRREIKEELGIDVKVGEKLISFEHLYSHKKLNFTVHICEFESGKPKPLSSQKLLWISPDRLFEFPFPAANTKIISVLHKHLGI